MAAGDTPELFVVSHVGRDLLQSAAFFRSEALVIWEYVSNGLQYVDPGKIPEVRVQLEDRRRTIRVLDNGRGMDWLGLQHFFVMHGENQDRRQGRPGRGMFGTGKSAAFGIGETLRVRTVRCGRRSEVVLRRCDVETMASGDPIPVQTVEKEVETGEPNGTEVIVEGLRLSRLDQAKVVRYVEQHLARWRDRGARVFVNNRACEVIEPEVNSEHSFRPEPAVAGLLGDVELRVRVARAPLEEESRGVAVYSNGNWHENTLAGAEGKECAQYIFGEIDVPRLESDSALPPAFDMSRSMHLNPENRVVRALYSFIGPCIEGVRRQLVRADRDRQATEEAKRLARQADEIADLLNEDFREFRRQVAAARGRSSPAPGPDGAAPGGADEFLTPGELTFGTEVSIEGSPGVDRGRGGQGGSPRTLGSVLERDPAGSLRGDPAVRTRGRGTGGGIRVRFDAVGKSERRAKYVEAERTIVVNLDHPQIAAAKGSGTAEQTSFRHLAIEVALTEYAVALAQLLAASDELVEPSEALFHVRDTIDRLSRRAVVSFRDAILPVM
ncbi:MAG TPA: ATP-binding protein [Vicinamibacterales bacterium]|jgi:hypothetical protein